MEPLSLPKTQLLRFLMCVFPFAARRCWRLFWFWSSPYECLRSVGWNVFLGPHSAGERADDRRKLSSSIV